VTGGVQPHDTLTNWPK